MSPKLTANALQVLESRYLLKDADGKVIESPAQLFTRVAKFVASAEGKSASRWLDSFRELMVSGRFIPNSPTLMNAGKGGSAGQLSACFVLPIDDSLDGIFDSLKHAAKIHQSGGGTGFSFTRLRASGSSVKTSSGVASGPVSFMRIYDSATETIKQGGTRRGANMAILRVDHPDILEFIEAKNDQKSILNFNISVGATDLFMEAVRADGSFTLRNPATGAEVRRVRALEIFQRIASCAWQTGDPGLVFLDRMNLFNPTPAMGEMESTNPCVTGETRVLVEGEGFVPIRELVNRTPVVSSEDPTGQIFRRVTQVVRTGIRPVHRLRTMEGHELRLTSDHRVMTSRGDVAAGELCLGDRIRVWVAPSTDREPGLVSEGHFANFRDLLPDGEEEVFDLCEPHTRHFHANGILVHNCGEQPLLPFESCNLGSLNLAKYTTPKSVDWSALRRDIQLAVRFLDDVIEVNVFPVAESERITLRNRKIGLGVMGFADLLLILGVPYDTVEARTLGERIMSFLDREAKRASAMLAHEKGAFPNFKGSLWHQLGYPPMRNATVSTVAPTGTISIIAGASSGIEPIFSGFYYRNVLAGARLVEIHPAVEEALRKHGRDPRKVGDQELGKVLGRAWRPAQSVPIEDHVLMQAAFQRHSDSAVSKTINLPEEATVDAVAQAYMLAYEAGCKGITVYRDRSRSSQVLERPNEQD